MDEMKDFALALGQSPNKPVQQAVLFSLLDERVWPKSGGIDHPGWGQTLVVSFDLIGFAVEGTLRTTADAAQMVEREVHRNPKQPAAQRAGAVPLVGVRP